MKSRIISLSFLILFVTLSVAEKVRFDHFRVFKLRIENESQLKILQDLETDPKSGYEFFESPLIVGPEVDIVVPPSHLTDFRRICDEFSFESSLWIENLQKLIDDEQPEAMPREDFGWSAYYATQEIYDWLEKIASTFYNEVDLFEYGESYENRTLYGLKISYGRVGNPVIFIEANIHAREWISSATATWIINELLTSEDPDVRYLAESFDWYILPLVNPDGFEYTKTNYRLWRKTRSPQANDCIGVDANRNFGFAWMENNGASSNPCSDTFAGPQAFSEPETAAIRDFYETIASDVDIYLSFHSYGQYILYPWGHMNSSEPFNKDDLTGCAKAAAEGLALKHGTKYTYGDTYDLLYAASGVSPDWAYGVYNTTLAYTYEFRDRGIFGFLLPSRYIIPNAEEVLDSLIALIDEGETRGYFRRTFP